MHPRHAICDPQRIELFLEQRMSDEEQADFEQHLDDCDDCRRGLEAAAADNEVWSGVRESLAAEPLPLELDTPSVHEGTAGSEASYSRAAVLEMLAPTDDDRMLGRLGTYEIVGVVGSGGMGVVLKGFDAALNRYVAIKVLAPHLATSGAARKRFSREAKMAAAVVHDNVIEIYGVDEASGLPYLVMPYVRGPSLQRRLDEEGPLALAEILRIGIQAASGLAAAHAQGLVHRDVKPANILLAEGIERVKLTDFGLARAADDASLTKTGVIAGTPQYMSPEQARGESVDARSDLFSLGSVLYAMCTGRAPFRAETSYGVLRRITDDEPRPIREINPEIPEWFCGIVVRLMAKQAEDRSASAREAAELLEACLAHLQHPTAAPLPEQLRSAEPPRGNGRAPADEKPGFPKRQAGPQRRISLRRMLAGAGAVLALLLAGFVIILELNKGTLIIESDADDVAVRVMQGDELVEKLQVTPEGANVRVAAGKYVVEIAGDSDGLTVENGAFALQRGGREIVRITQKAQTPPQLAPGMGPLQIHPPAAPDLIVQGKAKDVERTVEKTMLWNTYGVTPSPVSPLTAKVLEWMGLHLSPISKSQFREKNVFANYAGGLDVTFVRGHGPAEKAGVHEVDIVVKVQGRPAATLRDLDAAMQEAVEQLEQAEAETLQLDVLRSGETLRVNVPFSVKGDLAAEASAERNNAGAAPSVARAPEDAPAAGKAGQSIEEAAVKLEGLVTDSSDQELVEISIGSEDGLRLRDLLDVMRDKSYLGRISVVRLSPDKAVCRIESSQGEIRRGDRVVTEINPTTQATTPAAPEAPASDAPQRVGRFATSLTGHNLMIAISPDGELIAVANGNPTRILEASGAGRVEGAWKSSVEILDATSGKSLRSLPLTTEEEDIVIAATPWVTHSEATAIAFSPDGRLLAIGTSIGQIKLFDIQTGEATWSLDDEQAKLADQETPENWRSMPRALGSVRSLAFSPDGSLLAVCGESFAEFSDVFDGIEHLGLPVTGPGRLKLWDVAAGSLTQDLVGHSQAYAVAFSADGELLASAGRWDEGGDHDTGVVIWNANTGEKMRKIPAAANGGAHAVAFSPARKLAAIGSRQFDKENDSSSTNIRAVFPVSGIVEWQRSIPGWANPKAFSPDGNNLVVLCGGTSIQFLDAETGATKHEIQASEGERWSDLALSPDGRMLAIASVDAKRRGFVETWATAMTPNADGGAAAAPTPLNRFDAGIRGRIGNNLKVACSPDGELIAAGESWEMTPFPRESLRPNASYLGPTASAGVFDAQTGKKVATLALVNEQEERLLAETGRMAGVTDLAFSPDGTTAAIATSLGQVMLFDARSGALQRTLDDEQAKLADMATPEKFKTLKRAMGSVAGLAFSPDGRLLATCGGSFNEVPLGVHANPPPPTATDLGRLKIWDVASGSLKHDLTGHEYASAVTFSPDGSLLASAGRWWSENDVGLGAILWDLRTGEKFRAVTIGNAYTREKVGAERSQFTTSAAFSHDGKSLAVGWGRFERNGSTNTNKGGIALVDVASGATEWEGELHAWAESVAFLPDGKTVATLAGRRMVRFFDAATGNVRHEAPLADYGFSGKRWTDLALASRQGVLVIAGFDEHFRSFVELWGTGSDQAKNHDTPEDQSPPTNTDSSASPERGSESPINQQRSSRVREVVLSMDSLHFMLDLDTGQTMDPPASYRKEQERMDVHANQVQPSQTPAGLIGISLHATKVNPSDWDASPAAVREAAADMQPISAMPFDRAAPATYFFQTRGGAVGVLQMAELVDEPKGIRVRYKTWPAEMSSDRRASAR